MDRVATTINKKKYQLVFTDSFEKIMDRSKWLKRRGYDAKVIEARNGQYSLYLRKGFMGGRKKL